MNHSSKIVARKVDLKSVNNCKEIKEHIKNDTTAMITEIDMSHNMISDFSMLEPFNNLQQLIIDYNYLKNLNSLPTFTKLKVLSISYNQITDTYNVLQALTNRCPNLEHLNLMKNPCNPVFSNELFYQEFRAKFSIWLPSLKTLDGTDFKDD